MKTRQTDIIYKTLIWATYVAKWGSNWEILLSELNNLKVNRTMRKVKTKPNFYTLHSLSLIHLQFFF